MSPLAYLSVIFVDCVCPGCRLFASSEGTFHNREAAASRTVSCTLSDALATVAVPKRAVIVAVPAALASIRVLFTEVR